MRKGLAGQDCFMRDAPEVMPDARNSCLSEGFSPSVDVKKVNLGYEDENGHGRMGPYMQIAAWRA